ncbi:hypothetical protein M406DRAFT_240272, partial [Cryphonectria parasitica EP155]
LPRALHRYPSATIHYRWPQSSSSSAAEEEAALNSRFSTPTLSSDPSSATERLHWPTPIHDILAAYDHLVRVLLAPPPANDSSSSSSNNNNNARHLRHRDVYVYGSYLGAGLGAALALTESHTLEPVAVRGLVAVNGVYNWTTFLPAHPLNDHRALVADELGCGSEGLGSHNDEDDDVCNVGLMKGLMPFLFRRPVDLFDPFASPVLFFHTPGMMVPPGFSERWKDPPPPTPFNLESDAESDYAGYDALLHSDNSHLIEQATAPAPRKGYLTFPPRASTLKIPDTLLLHTTSPPLPPLPSTVAAALWKRLRDTENSFASQAAGLAGLMRRSVEKVELRGRRRWDEEGADWEGEAGRRVGTGAIGRGGGPDDMGRRAEEMAMQWLEERL